MFRVEHDLFALFGEEFDALADHGEVFLRRRFDDVGHVADVAFAENGDVFGARREEGFQVAVLFGFYPFAARRAERDDFRVFQFHARDFLKELHLRGIGKGVARLDEVDAEPVERLDDFDFVVYRKGDVCALRTVAQGGIEYL